MVVKATYQRYVQVTNRKKELFALVVCHNLLSKCASVTQFAHLLFFFFALVCQRRADKLFQIEEVVRHHSYKL